VGSGLLEQSPQGEVVEASRNIDEAVHGYLAVRAAITRVEAVTGIKLAEWSERRIFVVENFNKNVTKFSGFRGGGQEVADPSVVGAETAARGFCGRVKDSEFIVRSEFCDEVSIFDDGEPRIAAVGGVHEQLEKLFTEGRIGRFHEGAAPRDAGERLELAGSQELDVPVFNARAFKSGFAVSAEMDLHVLRNSRVEIGSIPRCISVHPFFDGGGREVSDAVRDGGFEAGNELGNDRVLVGWIHRVGAADHQDEVDVELERLQSGDEFSDVTGMCGREKWNLHAGRFDGRRGHDFLHSGDGCEGAVCVAGESAFGVRHKASDEFEVGWYDAEFDVGLDLNGGGHNGERWVYISRGMRCIAVRGFRGRKVFSTQMAWEA